ncbi:endonuclease/exonuclease/phosphatase family protein [Phycicoccus jejuensis]|uniref:endonuclease/exonuclease/phosphatase family protein n=1 Tax=Phycicoccus jejuensis TaxID=367299 RepID=UPI0004C449A5|nr:endonuclease/exonuclease/phosphatase family protein [Phycicoccus jejuensis]
MQLRTRPILAALATVGVAAAGLVGTTATAPSAEAASSSVRVFSHNLEKKGTAINRVRELSDGGGPEVLLLQEVCSSLIPKLQDIGYTHYRQRRTSTKCSGDQGIGEAVVWTGKSAEVSGTVSVPLNATPVDNHTYGLACLDINHGGHAFRACSTHLVAGGAANDAFRHDLTKAIKATTGSWMSTKVVLVGGDFNTTPGSATMNAMYGVGSASGGEFRELAQSAGTGSTARSGKNTFYSKKIDYIFASKAATRTGGGTEQVKDSPSDHRVLFGAVPLR